jgi:hypothetical protein
VSLLFFSFFGALDFPQAWLVFSWGGLALLVMALGLLLWRWPEQLAFIVGFSGIWLTLSFGQVTLYLAALYVLVLWTAGRHPLVAGAALGLAALKPHLGVLAPLMLLWRRQYLFFSSATITLLALIFVSWQMHGEVTWHAYEQAVLVPLQRLVGFEQLSSHQLISIYGGLRNIAVPTVAALGAQAAVMLAVLWVLWRICHSALSPQLPLAGFILASLLFSPHAYVYDLALLIVPLLVLVRRAQNSGWQVADLALVTLLYLAPIIHVPLQAHLGLSPVPVILFVALWHIRHLAYQESPHHED